jgi:hypothetical protein
VRRHRLARTRNGRSLRFRLRTRAVAYGTPLAPTSSPWSRTWLQMQRELTNLEGDERTMMIRLWNGRLFAMSVASGALYALGCGQADPSGQSSADTDTSVEEALNAVHVCQTQAKSCAPDAGGDPCDQQLRSCLSTAHSEGGASHARDEDGGSTGPSRDGAARPTHRDDAGDMDGSEMDDSEDGGRHAGRGATDGAVADPPKRTTVDAGISLSSCIADLRTCLSGAMPARQCASAAVTCLRAVRDLRH